MSVFDDDKNDVIITARTLYGEARGEGDSGMIAVADVIANRVAVAKVYVENHDKPHPLFGNGTFSDCCQRPYQFSCWNQNDPNLEKLLAVTTDDPIFDSAMQIAAHAVNGLLIDTTHAATYYKAVGTYASWAEGLEPCIVIGRQEFYNNVE